MFNTFRHLQSEESVFLNPLDLILFRNKANKN
uniref:Uncharacterized protein n=1 Tax=Nelumbo nucifera TaxID=4432 RepID=A0A822XN44_NELNU|nr:TPA_asm: hypothetical protein HUJ06_022586 [Nelumbo nucifera]